MPCGVPDLQEAFTALVALRGGRLTLRQFVILLLLYDQQTPLRAAEIGRRLKIDKSVAVRSISTLCDDGLLQREPRSSAHKVDWRVRPVRIAPDGAAYLDDLFARLRGRTPSPAH